MPYFADLAPQELPDIEYSKVDAAQAACIRKAMELPENRARFQVSFLPVETAEQRQAAAEEWAAYEQAKGDIQARERGAVMIIGGRDCSPEAFAELLEDKDEIPVVIPFRPFVTDTLLKVVKLNGQASTLELLRGYYTRTD